MTKDKSKALRPHCRVKVAHGLSRGAEARVMALRVLEVREDGKPERRMGALVAASERPLWWEPYRNLEAMT